MADRVSMLEARLAQIERRTERILQAAQTAPQNPREDELWWPYLAELFGGEAAIIVRTRIDQRLFVEALALVSNIPLETRGRRSAIRTPRERLLFLLIYMAKGVGVLEVLVGRFITKRENIHKMAKRIAKKYRGNLVGGLVRCLNERLPDVPNAALVVDCSVCQIKRPKRPFEEAKVFFLANITSTPSKKKSL